MLIWCGVFLGLFALYRVALEIQLRRAMGAIRAAGEPTTVAEAEAWLGPERTSVSSQGYRNFIIRTDIYENLRIGPNWRFLFPDDEVSLWAMSELLKAARILETTAIAGSDEMPDIHVPADLDLERYAATYESLNSVRYFCISAVHATAKGDADRAATSLRRAIEETSAGVREVSFTSIQQFEWHAMVILQTLDQVLGRGLFTEAQLLTLEKAFLEAEIRGRLREALVVRRARGLEVILRTQGYAARKDAGSILDILMYDELPFLGRAHHLFLVLSGRFTRESLYYLRHAERVIDRADMSGWEALAHPLDWDPASFSLYYPTMGDVGYWVRDPNNSIHLSEHRAKAYVRCARVAFAVERFMLAKGRLPSAIDELVPEFIEALPVDPFDGRAIRYTVSSGVYSVYSVGEDGVDDGGSPLGWARSGSKGDYVLEVVVE